MIDQSLPIQASKMQTAIDEIADLIRSVYPSAVFDVNFDVESAATWVTVEADFDIDHWDDVVDIYIERLLDIQDEWGLWLHFMPISSRTQRMQSSAA